MKRNKRTEEPRKLSGIEKRRFQRVHFAGDTGQAQQILGARCIWSTGEISDVYDLSFKGLAVSRPALVSVKEGMLQAVRLELGEQPPILVPAKIVWVRDQTIGLEIGDVSADAHLQLQTFMTDKLIGQHMRSVDRQFFSANENFNFWLQGPNGTVLLLWCDPNDPTRVVRVYLEIDGEFWEFENRRVISGAHLNGRALKILGQLQSKDFSLRDVIEKVAVLA